MPCYEIRKVTVELGAANQSLLLAGMKRDGLAVNQQGEHIHVSDGRTSLQIIGGRAEGVEGKATNDLINRVKRSYSREIIRSATRTSMKLTQQDNSTDCRKFLAQRRF